MNTTEPCEHHRALHVLGRHPALQALGGAGFGDAADQLQRPVHRGDEVHVHDQLEQVLRVDARLAGELVHPHRQLVAGDARRRHAQRHQAVLAADRVEHRCAELLVRDIALRP